MEPATVTPAPRLPLAIICPTCKMAPGVRCEDHNGLEVRPHRERRTAALGRPCVHACETIATTKCHHGLCCNDCRRDSCAPALGLR